MIPKMGTTFEPPGRVCIYIYVYHVEVYFRYMLHGTVAMLNIATAVVGL